ncbi:MAG: DUF1553 domain-containing protein, partial [Planctomycetales bacterium]|nr:DUF1553 domain-containing protein [Planctomycetales bacterium]
PTAALALLNDVQFVEAARSLATRVLTSEQTTDHDRLQLAFRLVVGREATAHELQRLQLGLAEDRADFATDDAAAKALISQGELAIPANVDPVELASWTVLANTLLNLDETLTKP